MCYKENNNPDFGSEIYQAKTKVREVSMSFSADSYNKERRIAVMLLEKLREQVAEYGLRMLKDGLTRGTVGYISARDPESGLICSTPSSVPYPMIHAGDVIVSDVDGNIIEGKGKVSSEWNVQRDIYKSREDIHALVHTHSRFSTTISSLHIDLPAASFSLCYAGTGLVKCAGYHLFYSQDLADDILDKLEGSKAVLMANHGMLATGNDLKEAYNLAQEIEFCAEVYWRASCIGQPYVLSEKEAELQIRELYDYSHVNDNK